MVENMEWRVLSYLIFGTELYRGNNAHSPIPSPTIHHPGPIISNIHPYYFILLLSIYLFLDFSLVESKHDQNKNLI